jgi:hypothetical protein
MSRSNKGGRPKVLKAPADRTLYGVLAGAGFPNDAALVRSTGLGHTTVNLVLRGLKVPHPRTIRTLAKALQVEETLLERLLLAVREARADERRKP